MKLARIPRDVYLDYAATTPIDPAVAKSMSDLLHSSTGFGNASSTQHEIGRAAAKVADTARQSVATFCNTDSRAVIFTSGATEANNLGVLGAARYRQAEGRHVISSQTEHRAILDPLLVLERDGFEITRLPPDTTGRVSAAAVEKALTAETVLVSLMLVNNETGVINDLSAVAALCRERDISLHIDAVQAPGKLALDYSMLAPASISLSAHKVYGPKGIGALVAPATVAPRLQPLIYGGGQERGLRAGTLPTHQLLGFSTALLRAEKNAAERTRIADLSARLIAGLLALPDVELNGDRNYAVDEIVNVTVHGVHGDSLIEALAPVAVSRGSACGSAHGEPSYVLRAYGRCDSEAESSLRFSLGRFTDAEDIELAVEQFTAAVKYLRSVAGSLTRSP